MASSAIFPNGIAVPLLLGVGQQFTGVSVKAMEWAPTLVITGAPIANITGWNLSPSITYNATGNFLANLFGIQANPILTFLTSGIGLGSLFVMFDASPLFISAITGATPVTPIVFKAGATIQSTANNIGTVGGMIGFKDLPGVLALTSATSAVAVTAMTSFLSAPQMRAQIAGSQATVTTRTAVSILDPVILASAGTITITDNIAIDIAALTTTSGNAPISLRSAGSTVEMRHAGPARFGSSVAGPTGGSIVHVDGGLTYKRTVATDANYTALTTDLIIEFPAITASRSVLLPAAATAGAGKIYIIKKTTGAFTVVVDPNGAELIDGAATVATAIATYDKLRIYCTGTAWMTW